MNDVRRHPAGFPSLILQINSAIPVSSESMATILEKLNLKDHQEILVLRAPSSFEPELARLPVVTIHHHLESVAQIRFALAFVTRKSEVDAFAPQIAARAVGDATVWFAYPKGTSKKLKCDFNRNTDWDALKSAGFDSVRAIAIDEDWTALRFRRKEFIKAR
jgi:predicted oxidoreductase (fatty acid repression mutant protein)